MVQRLLSARKGQEKMSTTTEYRQLLAKYAPQPIRSQASYTQALAQLEELMVAHPNAARSLLIEVLATLIEKYESREHPTPKIAPAQMLKTLLRTKGVKPAEVAKTTGIPTATLSNVLARRRGISKQNAFKLGEFFGMSPMVFLEGPPQKKAAVCR
jgi:HTH-type transcriptional regulator / antitoxin HigA